MKSDKEEFLQLHPMPEVYGDNDPCGCNGCDKARHYYRSSAPLDGQGEMIEYLVKWCAIGIPVDDPPADIASFPHECKWQKYRALSEDNTFPS